MSSLAHVAVHPSQFPGPVRSDLLASLRTRQVNHKFLYDSVKQTQKWLALHAAFSPNRTDPDCLSTFDRSFAAAADQIKAPLVHLVGLGCGGGQKDTRLLRLLQDRGKELTYCPVDVSPAMVLVARETALSVLSPDRCFPLVGDLAAAGDLTSAIDAHLDPAATRLLTFFGMLPNFEPQDILPQLASLLRHGDVLLASANLAPGPDYDKGIMRILPLYDNALTRDWLMTFLLDLGVEPNDGKLDFHIQEYPPGGRLKRIVAAFLFTHTREIRVDDQAFRFMPGDSVRLFYSYRHTVALLREWLEKYRLRILDQWIAASEEEGVFRISRSGHA